MKKRVNWGTLTMKERANEEQREIKALLVPIRKMLESGPDLPYPPKAFVSMGGEQLQEGHGYLT